MHKLPSMAKIPSGAKLRKNSYHSLKCLGSHVASPSIDLGGEPEPSKSIESPMSIDLGGDPDHKEESADADVEENRAKYITSRVRHFMHVQCPHHDKKGGLRLTLAANLILTSQPRCAD